jgi:hypothetical protein
METLFPLDIVLRTALLILKLDIKRLPINVFSLPLARFTLGLLDPDFPSELPISCPPHFVSAPRMDAERPRWHDSFDPPEREGDWPMAEIIEPLPRRNLSSLGTWVALTVFHCVQITPCICLAFGTVPR